MSHVIGSTQFAQAQAILRDIEAKRKEIALANEKLNGIKGAIVIRQNQLARLEAQLVSTSSPRPTDRADRR